METNIPTTQVCSCCGQELPIEDFMFNPRFGKHNKICKVCTANKRRKTITKKNIKEEAVLNPELEKFTARELILELRARGYKGELSYIEIKRVVI